MPEPKGRWSGSGAVVSPDADAAPPANRWDLTRTGMYTERGKPDVLPLGKQAVRQADRAAGKGCRRKRRLSCNGVDTG